MSVAEGVVMVPTTSLLQRIALLTVLTTSTTLAGCMAPDDVEEDEPASSETSELASAGIVPQVSIRGVKMGMTFSEVRAALGTPEHVVKFDDSSRIRWWEYVKIGHTMIC